MRTLFNPWFLIAVVLLLIGAGAGAAVYTEMHRPQPQPASEVAYVTKGVIGRSVEGRPIEAYTLGSGARRIVLVGGMHGGYEWNSVLLAYEMLDYLSANQAAVPEDVSLTIVPDINPDAVFKAVGKEGRFALEDASAAEVPEARFNAHMVDLNRNFDCNWQATSTWRSAEVSAGTAAFSEPETRALRDFVAQLRPQAVVFWHSQANAVYASECNAGILAGTRAAMEAYARAAGYPAVDTFDAYAITGDAEGWLASQNIPAITVELASHTNIEFERNLAGVQALLASVGK